MMKTLTEQWREGTLDNGFYYVRSGWSAFIEIRYLGEGFFEGNIEVLAPVPRYDEIKRLKEQLKEANKAIKEYAWDSGYWECGYHYKDSFFANVYIKKWGVK